MRRNILLLAGLLCFQVAVKAQKEQYLIAGCGMDKVAVIDRKGEIFWEIPVEKADCNDAEITREGNVLFGYKYGAKLVGRNQHVIWDYPVEFPKEEMYTATQLHNGNYLLACCGKPARILELDGQGKVVHELKYDTGVENVHGQFRQIIQSPSDTYILPIMGKGVVREISRYGKVIREAKVEGNPFQVSLLKDGNWLVACGDGHSWVEVNPEKNEIVKRVGERDLPFCKLQFVAELTRIKNGHTLVANWNGHDRKDQAQPIAFEIDKNNQLIWAIYPTEEIKRISTLSPVKNKFKKLK